MSDYRAEFEDYADRASRRSTRRATSAWQGDEHTFDPAGHLLRLLRAGDPLCAGDDVDRWVEVRGHHEAAELKAICRACPLRQACAAYASRHDLLGVWGATTQAERRKTRRKTTTTKER